MRKFMYSDKDIYTDTSDVKFIEEDTINFHKFVKAKGLTLIHATALIRCFSSRESYGALFIELNEEAINEARLEAISLIDMLLSKDARRPLLNEEEIADLIK